MERADRAAVSTFYAPGAWADRVELGEAAAHHAQVKRIVSGDQVRLTSGDGRVALGVVVECAKRRLVLGLDATSIQTVSAPTHVELVVPVADRDRMLFLAEKCVELGLSSWRPVVFTRSRSVSSRGEGQPFRDKLRLRQISALEQCGSAWLPENHDEVALEVALAGAGGVGSSLLLDADGESLGETMRALDVPVRIALGPEGGLEESERAQFIRAGWRSVSLGSNVLRFETAGIAALAIVRSRLR